ncbi:histidine phosphatase family protein [Dictyobacter aurantiacus]|uniref:Phosphoglycerate mutase n=1 Tax=Dictyobacter aurantiacus TaxID=1936993 RepID=A0A401ZS87_9CHLR|nr:histidine phosphatase family protein [Dictyobacter aurantiacus]GCE09640.1 phosphoglycerate mutase [Dictyobacter aurantiacus]
MTTNLYLIRHGEALSAIQGTIGNSELSPLGIVQAEHLRDRLAATHEIKADVFMCSTLHRARQTAQIIAPALDSPLLVDEEIEEMRAGGTDGMPAEEYQRTYGPIDFRKAPLKQPAPGGESWGEFQLRVGTALERIVNTYEDKTIVLVCHGGIIDGSFIYFFRLSSLAVPQAGFRTRNTSITHWQKRGPDRRWRLMRYNDALHLHDIGTPARIPWDQIRALPASDEERPTEPVPTEEHQ